jgi:hypothetical protein
MEHQNLQLSLQHKPNRQTLSLGKQICQQLKNEENLCSIVLPKLACIPTAPERKITPLN